MEMGTFFRHHRLPGNFCFITLAPYGNEKSPCSPKGTRTESTNSAVPPCLPYQTTASERCQHTVCPITLALRQKILWIPISLCPRRPICCPALRSALSYAKLSVDALAALLPLRWFVYEVMLVIHHRCPFVKYFFSRWKDNFFLKATPHNGSCGLRRIFCPNRTV